jgi:hypothetical protein
VRKVGVLAVALALAATGLVFQSMAAPKVVMAACHVGGEQTKTYSGSKTWWAPDTTYWRISVTFRYYYDCSWSMTGVEVLSRSVRVTVDGRTDWMGYERTLVSAHVLARTIDPDRWALHKGCRAAYCRFPATGTYTRTQKVFIPKYAWADPSSAPRIRVYCQSCSSTGMGDLVWEFAFLQNKGALLVDYW